MMNCTSCGVKLSAGTGTCHACGSPTPYNLPTVSPAYDRDPPYIERVSFTDATIADTDNEKTVRRQLPQGNHTPSVPSVEQQSPPQSGAQSLPNADQTVYSAGPFQGSAQFPHPQPSQGSGQPPYPQSFQSAGQPPYPMGMQQRGMYPGGPQNISQKSGPNRLLFIGLAVLIIIGLLVGLVSFINQISGQHSQTVSTPATNLPTATPTPAINTTTDPQNLYKLVTNQTPTLDDPLASQGINAIWIPLVGQCTFTGGTLHSINTSSNAASICLASPTNFSNFGYEVQVANIKGDTSGIIFRADNLGRKLYLFGVDTSLTGAYVLSAVTGNAGGKQTILAGGSSSAIMSGSNQTNRLMVIARGNSLYLYINQQYITKVDDSISSSGEIGLFSADSRGNPTEASFSHLKVWSL